MGEPVGDEYTAGDPCDTCWGPGKPFGDVPTPKYVAIHLTGLAPPFDGANKKWIGQQDPDLPCFWMFEDANYGGYYAFIGVITELYLAVKPGWWPEITFVSGPCDDSFAG